MFKLRIALAAIAAALAIAPAAHGIWLPDGNTVYTGSGSIFARWILPDGAGGAVIVWSDQAIGTDTMAVLAQRLDNGGNPIWGMQGISVCSVGSAPVIASDGFGGAFFAWTYDNPYPEPDDIYAQRVTAGGGKWNAGGMPVCAQAAAQLVVNCSPDGYGGAFILWMDDRIGQELYVQRIDAGGNGLWAADGVRINQYGWVNAEAVADGGGGAIIVWHNEQGIYAQRVSAGGSLLWATNGTAIAAKPDTMEWKSGVVSDGTGGAVIVWYEQRGSTYHAMAQRIDGNGNLLWASGGVALDPTPGFYLNSRLVSLGSGGSIRAYLDNRNGNMDIFAQRLDANGNELWGTYGVPLCTGAENQSSMRLIKADDGSALITWIDNRNGNDDIFAQKIDTNATVLWATNGIPVCTHSTAQQYMQTTTDDDGGAFLAWSDGRVASGGVYVQRVLSLGHVATDAAPAITSILDVPNDQGGWVNLQWERSFLDCLPDTEITHYSIWRRMPEGAASLLDAAVPPGGSLDVPRDFKGECLRTAYDYAWEWLENVPAHHFELYSQTAPTQYDSTSGDPGRHWYMISAHTSNPAIYYDSAVDSGYSLDNLSPVEPAGLAGEPNLEPAGLLMTWDENAETDLGRYHVYRGLTEGFVPGAENLVASPIDATWLDEEWTSGSGYYYKVSATDVHGNESSHTLLRPDDITGAETPKAPTANYLAQNFPNPFNPVTKIVFGLSAPGNVSLRIFDAAGRLVRVLVEEPRAAAHYIEIWDGRDSRGAAVASGIYFSRLNAGAFTETRKMVLLR